MTIMENHHYAMELADKADLARRAGQPDKAKELFLEAFHRESLAAMSFKDRHTIEPTRGVLFRSAASLAMECGEFREAEKMIAYGLTGTPPEEIAEELRDLLETVNFERHLCLRGITLDPHEMQMSIWGSAIGLGFALSREFRDRIEKIESLSYRTLERKLGMAFREAGRLAKEIAHIFEVYVSVPRPASFAVTIRLAGDQQSLPGLDLGEDVVSEIVECMDLLDKQGEPALRERIPDKDYFDNFVGLAKQMAPDGKRVSYVGFTLQKDGVEKHVKLERRRSDWDSTTVAEIGDSKSEEEPGEIRGMLKSANARMKKHGVIELVDVHNGVHKVKVPLGMMADIVRPMFDFEVIVKGKRDRRGTILLDDISPAGNE